MSSHDLNAERDPGTDTTSHVDRTESAPRRWQPFPTHLLPLPFAVYVAASARAIGCDEASVAIHLLAAAAAAIGTSRRIALKPTWTEPAVLWTVTVADSGSLKSPAFDAAVRFTQAVNARAMAKHAEDALKGETPKLADAGKRPTPRRSGQDQPPPVQQVKPQPFRVLATDATIEAVGALLALNPRGLLLGRDELSAWFGSFGRYTGARTADASSWLELYGARQLSIDRKGAAEPLFIARAACSITGTIQPTVLRRIATPEALASGLLARFLLVWPPERPRVWTDATVHSTTTDATARVFDALFDLSARDEDQVELPLTSEACGEWVRFYNDHGARIAGAEPRLGAALSKIEGAAARFALVHALVVDPSTTAVPAESVRAGCELARWFSEEAARIYGGLLNGSLEDPETVALIERIRRSGGGMTPSELARASRRHKPSSRARDALRQLEQKGHGKLAWKPSGESGGRPSERFELTESPRTRGPASETPAAGNVKARFGDTDDNRARERPVPGLAGHDPAPTCAEAHSVSETHTASAPSGRLGDRTRGNAVVTSSEDGNPVDAIAAGHANDLPSELEERAACEYSVRVSQAEPDLAPGELFGNETARDYDGH